ncbi:hypothetical protein P3342_010103 [Pyrenophora teres f. teres]|nr:hypothetical protein P3342_010103 [Pyrenophora teres f. teres]
MMIPRLLHRALPVAVSPQARASYLALYSISRRTSLPQSHWRASSRFNRSDFSGQGFSSFYEPDQPTRGPLGSTSNVGVGHITPKALRQHLDQFVVDQDRAKIVLSVAVHEHHLRIQELKRQLDEQARLDAQAQRRATVYSRHPVEDEFPGQQSTVELHSHNDTLSYTEAPSYKPTSPAP